MKPCSLSLSADESAATSTMTVALGSRLKAVKVTPGMALSMVLVVLVIGMLLTSSEALEACTALSAALSPETPSLSASPKATPVPPVRLLVTVKALASPVSLARQHQAVARRAGLHDRRARRRVARGVDGVGHLPQRGRARERDGEAANRERAAGGHDGGVGVGSQRGRGGDLGAGQFLHHHFVAPGQRAGARRHRHRGRVTARGREPRHVGRAGELGGGGLQGRHARGQRPEGAGLGRATRPDGSAAPGEAGSPAS